MKSKPKINEQNLDTEEVKRMDLDEQPRPTRKLDRPATPSVDSSTGFSHRRQKGTRKAR